MPAHAFVSYYLMQGTVVLKAAGALAVRPLAAEKLHLQTV